MTDIFIPEHEMKFSNEWTNLLLWGVKTDEEIKKICEEFRDKPIFKFDPDHKNPFHKPKSEWTPEMIQQMEEFKKKHHD